MDQIVCHSCILQGVLNFKSCFRMALFAQVLIFLRIMQIERINFEFQLFSCSIHTGNYKKKVLLYFLKGTSQFAKNPQKYQYLVNYY